MKKFGEFTLPSPILRISAEKPGNPMLQLREPETPSSSDANAFLVLSVLLYQSTAIPSVAPM